VIILFGIRKIELGRGNSLTPIYEVSMKTEIIVAIQNHKEWIDSLSKNGKKIVLEEEIIEGIEWSNVDLSQSSFIECTFRKSIMNGWNFYAAMLCSTHFEELSILSAEFVKANLAYTQFFNTQMRYINFSKADLSNSVFENVEIENCKFINSLLDGVDFRNVHFRNVDFTGALLENVIFDNASVLKETNGLDDAHIKSINIGTTDKPLYLKGQEALLWLKNIATN